MAEVIKLKGSLQFITHKTDRYNELQGAEMALKGGCRWIQLRMKDAPEEDVLKTGLEMRKLCDSFEAILIIDDHVNLVKQIKADGVHLGLNDMPIGEARRMLGEEYIIGGTANTEKQVVEHYRNGVDYVGCGPFRFTTTKKNLSPILGENGYLAIKEELQKEGVFIPVVAIGGITYEDIDKIMHTRVEGIAVSGTILNAADPEAETQRIVRKMNTFSNR